MEVEIVYEIGRDICRDLSEDESISGSSPALVVCETYDTTGDEYEHGQQLCSKLWGSPITLLRTTKPGRHAAALLRRIASYGLPASSASD